MCTEDDPAVSYCETCGKHLCDFCHKAHKRQVDFRSHKVTPVSELGPEAALLTMERPRHCKSHTGEVLKLYCKTCHKLICRDCTIVDHRHHEYGFNSDLRPQIQEEVVKTTTALKQKQQKFEQHRKLLLEFEKGQEEYTAELERDITTTFNSYIKRLESHRDKLLKQVQASKDADMKQIWAQKQHVETTLAGIASALRYASRLCGCASDTVMLAMRSEATAHFESLQSTKWSALKLQLCTPFVFKKSNPQIEATSGQLNEITQQHVSISVSKKLPPGSLREADQDHYFQRAHYSRQPYENISLGKTAVLSVKVNNTTKNIPRIIPSVSITKYNQHTGAIYSSNSFTLSNNSKTEWTLDFFPTQSCQYTVSVKPAGYKMFEENETVHEQFWEDEMYAESATYTIQVTGTPPVGSRVCRGPNWKSGENDGGIGSEGTVLRNQLQQHLAQSLYYNRQQVSVCVRWDKTGKTGEYQFDEKQGVFEIELVPLA